MNTVRLWIYWNGLVRLTLLENHKLHIHESKPIDEGFSYRGETYYLDGEMVRCEVVNGGRDCDGRIDYFIEYECHLSELAARCCDADDQIMMPKWKQIDSSQRDYYAEAMGY